MLELPEEEVNQGKLLMYNRAELKTSDHRSQLSSFAVSTVVNFENCIIR